MFSHVPSSRCYKIEIAFCVLLSKVHGLEKEFLKSYVRYPSNFRVSLLSANVRKTTSVNVANYINEAFEAQN